jgi:glycosyltransferase involved in cell wall biosynthesis
VRILLLAQFFPPVIGGEERHVQDLAIQLSRRGHDVVVGTQRHAGAPDVEELDGYTVRRVGSVMGRLGVGSGDRRFAPPFPDPETSLALRRLGKEFKPDIVHAHNWIINSWIPVKPFVKAPLVWTLHAFGLNCATHRMVYAGNPCSGPGAKKCLGCAQTHYGKAMGTIVASTNATMVPVRKSAVDMFVSVSTDVAKRNGVWGTDLPQRIIPNFTDVEASKTPAPADLELDPALPVEPFILFVGDQSKDKGLPDLLEAYRRAGEPMPLVVIGRPVDSLPDWVASDPNITVINGWPYMNVVEAFRRCAFSVAPSRWAEPFGLVIIEAMLQAKPVIGANHGGITDIIEDGETGFLIEPRNVDDLTDRLEKLSSDGDLREQMGTKAKESVRRFDVGIVISELESLYDELIATTAEKASA